MAHGFVTFNGLDAHIDGGLHLTHGIAPAQLQLRIPPNPKIKEGGTLALISGGTRIEFQGCKVDRVDAIKGGDGLVIWSITVLDRRWKWKECGKISGYYNVREGENADAKLGIPKQVKKGTEKNARQLCQLCLEAMGEGEFGYNISKVPTDIFPEIEWDYENPTVALLKIAESLKFRIVFNWRKNQVELWPDGEGQKLTTQGTIDYQLTIDPPERPDGLVFVGSRMLWESDLELEAVARDAAGKYHLLNDAAIPYRPRVDPIEGNFFWNFDREFGHTIFDTPTNGIHGINTWRDLAKADVYRKYRVKAGFSIAGQTITNIDRILPLLSTRLHIDNRGENNKPLPPVVWGLFYRDTAKPNYWSDLANPRTKLDLVNPPKDMTWKKGFQVDEKTGIVEFSEPNYQFGKKPNGIKVDGKVVDWAYMKPSKLWLRIGFGIREAVTRGWFHFEVPRGSTANQRFGTLPKYIKADDAVYRTIRGRDKDFTNEDEYVKIANHYLDQEERKYEVRDPCAATYAGWLPIVPDGAIKEITWEVKESGCTTHVNRNREDPYRSLTWEEKLQFTQAASQVANTPTTSRALADKQERRPA